MKETILRVVVFIPAIFMMFIIWGFSNSTGEESNSLSLRIAQKGTDFYYMIIGENKASIEDQEEVTQFLNYPIRKTAHMTEYALLAVALIFGFIFNKIKDKYCVILCLLVCLLYAISDETHQVFVSDRTPKAGDVCFDVFGACIGTMTYVLVKNKGKKDKAH